MTRYLCDTCDDCLDSKFYPDFRTSCDGKALAKMKIAYCRDGWVRHAIEVDENGVPESECWGYRPAAS